MGQKGGLSSMVDRWVLLLLLAAVASSQPLHSITVGPGQSFGGPSQSGAIGQVQSNVVKAAPVPANSFPVTVNGGGRQQAAPPAGGALMPPGQPMPPPADQQPASQPPVQAPAQAAPAQAPSVAPAQPAPQQVVMQVAQPQPGTPQGVAVQWQQPQQVGVVQQPVVQQVVQAPQPQIQWQMPAAQPQQPIVMMQPASAPAQVVQPQQQSMMVVQQQQPVTQTMVPAPQMQQQLQQIEGFNPGASAAPSGQLPNADDWKQMMRFQESKAAPESSVAPSDEQVDQAATPPHKKALFEQMRDNADQSIDTTKDSATSESGSSSSATSTPALTASEQKLRDGVEHELRADAAAGATANGHAAQINVSSSDSGSARKHVDWSAAAAEQAEWIKVCLRFHADHPEQCGQKPKRQSMHLQPTTDFDDMCLQFHKDDPSACAKKAVGSKPSASKPAVGANSNNSTSGEKHVMGMLRGGSAGTRQAYINGTAQVPRFQQIRQELKQKQKLTTGQQRTAEWLAMCREMHGANSPHCNSPQRLRWSPL